MAQTSVSSDQWTLIGDNVTSITFQNVSQWPFYVGFNTSNTAPSESYGLVYGPYQGEVKRDITELTYLASPTHVFARAITKTTTIVVETE